MFGAQEFGGLPFGGGGEPGGTVPVFFSGTVPTQNAAVGTPFGVDLASYFSGTLTPFTYNTEVGTLPAGLTRTGSVISGTPTIAGISSGITIRATDTGSNVADTNSFGFVVAAAPPPPPTGTPGVISRLVYYFATRRRGT